jgi:hypothetical protein
LIDGALLSVSPEFTIAAPMLRESLATSAVGPASLLVMFVLIYLPDDLRPRCESSQYFLIRATMPLRHNGPAELHLALARCALLRNLFARLNPSLWKRQLPSRLSFSDAQAAE